MIRFDGSHRGAGGAGQERDDLRCRRPHVDRDAVPTKGFLTQMVKGRFSVRFTDPRPAGGDLPGGAYPLGRGLLPPLLSKGLPDRGKRQFKFAAELLAEMAHLIRTCGLSLLSLLDALINGAFGNAQRRGDGPADTADDAALPRGLWRQTGPRVSHEPARPAQEPQSAYESRYAACDTF
ncbi:hypothetical protein ACFQX6_66960 [Streptosporangium lutulentum]